ncbi:MAG: MgtC/SapB family protein [Parvibaculaceae bacterium]
MDDLLPPSDVMIVYQRLALALGIGLIVGLERGWQQRESSSGSSAAGVRTFALMGFLGGLAGLAGQVIGDLFALVIAVGFFGFVIAAYVVGLRPVQGRVPDKGMTTEVAALITFVLGVLSVRGDMTVAAISAVVLVTLLNLKEPLHHALQQMKAFELQAAIKLMLISIVVLPFLPNKGYGPAGIWNPFELWWMVVLIAAISFGGYFAIRIIGTKKGPLVMGVLGGLASSTALTVSASRFVSRLPVASEAFAGAIAVSAAVSFVRTLLLASVLYPPLAIDLGIPLAVAAGVAVLGGLWLQNRAAADADHGDAIVDMGSPDDLGTALKFGLVLFGVITLAHYATEWLGPEGLYSVAALSGLVDVDAVTLSVSRLANTSASLETSVAAGAILIAAFVNTAVKVGIGAYLAGKRLAGLLTAVFLACFAAAVVSLLVV